MRVVVAAFDGEPDNMVQLLQPVVAEMIQYDFCSVLDYVAKSLIAPNNPQCPVK